MNYEEEVKEIIEENQKYIMLFFNELNQKGLTEKTIRKHINNVDFYINDFLNYYEPTQMKEGCYKIDEFLGDWFIRKAMWSNQATIKQNAASLKKFYKCMLEHQLIERNDYKELCDTIKDSMSTWIRRVTKYNDIDIDDWYM